MPPNWLAMVPTGSASPQLATEAATTAISRPGQCGLTLLRTTITPMVSSASAVAAALIVSAACESASILATNGPGSLPSSRRPSRSFTWLAKMMTAMPEVKPTVTG